MKKHLIFLSLLLIFTVAVSSLAVFSLDSKKEAVTVTEQKLRGDKSLVDGLTVTSAITLDDHLLWEIGYTLGNDPHLDADFAFSLSELEYNNYNRRISASVDLNIPAGCNTTTDEPQKGLAAVYRSLYDSLSNGGEASKRVKLSDYYEYYPLAFNFFMPGIQWQGIRAQGYTGKDSYADVQDTLNEYFKIPVMGSTTLTVSVSRNSSGSSLGFGMSYDGDMYSANTASAHTASTCYFTISPFTTSGKSVDLSQIRGGYGIYAIDYSTPTSNADTGIDADSIRNAFVLAPGTLVTEMMVTKDSSSLVALAKEEGRLALYVISLDGMSLTEKFTFENQSGAYLYQGDGFIMLYFGNDLALVDMRDPEKPTLAINTPVEHLDTASDLYHTRDLTQAVFDGKTLVMCDFLKDRYGFDRSSFYVAAYTADGLGFYAEYVCSLDINHSAIQNANPSPLGEGAIRIEKNE